MCIDQFVSSYQPRAIWRFQLLVILFVFNYFVFLLVCSNKPHKQTYPLTCFVFCLLSHWELSPILFNWHLYLVSTVIGQLSSFVLLIVMSFTLRLLPVALYCVVNSRCSKFLQSLEVVFHLQLVLDFLQIMPVVFHFFSYQQSSSI